MPLTLWPPLPCQFSATLLAGAVGRWRARHGGKAPAAPITPAQHRLMMMIGLLDAGAYTAFCLGFYACGASFAALLLAGLGQVRPGHAGPVALQRVGRRRVARRGRGRSRLLPTCRPRQPAAAAWTPLPLAAPHCQRLAAPLQQSRGLRPMMPAPPRRCSPPLPRASSWGGGSAGGRRWESTASCWAWRSRHCRPGRWQPHACAAAMAAAWRWQHTTARQWPCSRSS